MPRPLSAWPFNADLVLRKTGVRRHLPPNHRLSLLARLLQDQGHTPQLLRRNARFASLKGTENGAVRQGRYVKEQAWFALELDGRLLTDGAATDWTGILADAHAHLTSSAVTTPSHLREEVRETVWLHPAATPVALEAVDRELLARARALVGPMAAASPLTLPGRPVAPLFPQGVTPMELDPVGQPPFRFFQQVLFDLARRGHEGRLEALTDAMPTATPGVQAVRRRARLWVGPYVLHSDGCTNSHALAFESANDSAFLTASAAEWLPPEKAPWTQPAADRVVRLLDHHRLLNALPEAPPRKGPRL